MGNSHNERHQAAMSQLIDRYGQLEELLDRLPLPVRLPPLQGQVYRADVSAGLVHAFTAVGDLPMDGEARRLLREVIGDWLTTVGWMFGDEEEEAAWHLDIVHTQLHRIDTAIQESATLLARS